MIWNKKDEIATYAFYPRKNETDRREKEKDTKSGLQVW